MVTTIPEVRDAVRRARQAGRTIGLVPTMGALHDGHTSLIKAAKADGHFTVVSIYVNPTQFGPSEDFQQYPRTLDADREACQAAGGDSIFAPQDAEIYPAGDQTRVRPGPLAESLCGAVRPGHFEGVCTVVAKLFNIVQPDAAYFGQKDAQQAVILRRMVADLCLPVRIEVCPLVRESDGLALSSRNARLSPEQRGQAICLYTALCLGRDRLVAGEQSVGGTIAAMREVIAEAGPNIDVDYLSIVDPETLAPITAPHGRVMLAGAVRIGETRLIDNMLVDLPANGA
ncbi:MAG: pantoate--beta-alanine ligase [Planctomycetota bacterium]